MLEFGNENEEIIDAPFVIEMSDNGDNELRIIIALSARSSKEENIFDDSLEINKILANSCPIYEDMENLYEIIFENYILYQCRNESYTSYDNCEVRKGNYLIIFEKSRLLDYYEDVIFDFDYESEKSHRKHYGIYTQRHIIDVISNQFNQNNNNINYPIKEEKPNYMNIIFKSGNSMANQSNLVLNDNIPIGIALSLYLIKSGRENDLFQLIKNRNSISF